VAFFSFLKRLPRDITSNLGELQIEQCNRLSRDEISALIASHEKVLNSGKGVLKKGPRTAVTRVRHGCGWLCIKEYRSNGLLDQAKEALCGTRARRALKGANKLTSCGIATPEIIAVAELGKKSYLFTPFMDEATPLNLILQKPSSSAMRGQMEVTDKRKMIYQLGRWLRHIHDLGVYHNDWSANNILVNRHGREWSFYLVDTESISYITTLTYRRRVKNLSQLGDTRLGITCTDRMRFLGTYANKDVSLTRGHFPRHVIRAMQRRFEASQKTRARARKRKIKLKRKMAKATHRSESASKRST